ncbi:alpha,alpha-phosphotrehalase [Mesoplasma tabanidae]|uniref:Trehalose-6-phosphate hydrolase n=1 Tax=Mesoplasma tabanidae TaxID=219745 RepID=A0A2K8P5J7_9MOLU|nr:alpha,alpha-phosphotrehalase [Mesoplasma tabanidae]ATZ21738.1 trehalose-6-phosphate hydrolase [Mesoplasma tabanidae]
MRNEVIYQIFPLTFSDGQKKGKGNIKGIINKLDYLKNLGITRIWISPFTKSPFKDSGYDVSDYCKINENFGSIEDVELLILEAKKRNLTIILDIVFNHTSNKHEWFQKALAGDQKYMNYYIFKDPIDGKEPTNWKSKMGGLSWEYVPSLNKYYLHLFTKEQPDLNWENPEVREELISILNFWKNKGISGFRLDVCNLYSKPSLFENDQIGDGRRFYTDGSKVEEYFNLMNNRVFGKDKQIFTVGEVSSTTKEKSAKYAKLENNELDSVFTFLHLKVDYENNDKWTNVKPDLSLFWKLQKEWQEYYQSQNSTLALFMNNHDQPRAVSRFGNTDKYWYESATSIFAFTSLMRGVPFIYQGEEIGMTNLKFNKISEFKDVESIGNANDLLKTKSKKEVLDILRIKSRDNARSVMQWSDELNAGFSEKQNISLFVNQNYKKINVQQQLNDKKSILSFYKKIISLRLNNEVFNEGKINFFENQDYAYSRTFKDKEIIILTNWTTENKLIKLKLDCNNWKIILNNYNEFDFNSLKPYQVVAVERK